MLSNSVAEWDGSVAKFAVCFFDFWFVKYRWPNGMARGPNCRDMEQQKHIFGPDFLQFYEGYFYCKYRLCIRVNLEIEGAETRVQKDNNKTKVCIEFVSWQQTLGFEG